MSFLEIPLTPLRVGHVAIIDEVDAPLVFDDSLVAGRAWGSQRGGSTVYAQISLRIEGKAVTVLMHRLIVPVGPQFEVDHINGNGLDNRRSNLRPVTTSQNGMNRRARTGCSSQYKGVSRNQKAQRWEAYIRLDQKRSHLGYFTDEVEAARAYDAAARELFGDHALCNFPT